MSETTRQSESTAPATVYVAFDLGLKEWHLAVSRGTGEAARRYRVDAGDVVAVLEKLRIAKAHWSLPADVRTVSIYEAGREGFWLHRFLTAHGIANHVVEASSLEKSGGQRQAKTDRLDAARLLALLIEGLSGQKKLRLVRVPTEADEDARQRSRELTALKRDRTMLRNRIVGLLFTQGIRVRVPDHGRLDVQALRTWDGAAVPAGLRGRVERDLASVVALTERIRGLERTRDAAVKAAVATPPLDAPTPLIEVMTKLMRWRGVAEISAETLSAELFSWRTFANGRQLGALAGFTPTPFRSGTIVRDQGISKAGLWRVRRVMVQLAWSHTLLQPQSALTLWFKRRFGEGKRMRRVGIVALARKLLIALWRFVTTGEIPEGVVLKAAA